MRPRPIQRVILRLPAQPISLAAGLMLALNSSAFAQSQLISAAFILTTAIFGFHARNRVHGLFILFALLSGVSLFLPFDSNSVLTLPRYLAFGLYIVFFIANTSPSVTHIKVQILDSFFKASAILVFASVFSHLVGLNPFDNGRDDYRGFFVHSMVYAPISGLLASRTLSKMLDTNKLFRVHLVELVVYTIGVLQSGSRAALLCLAITGLFLLRSHLPRIISSLLLLTFSGMVFFLSDFLVDVLPNSMQAKFVTADSNQISITSSRDQLWSNRITEISEAPLFGVGFGQVDTKNINDFNESGNIELGSSWLGVVSMTGILSSSVLGLILFNALTRRLKSRQYPLLLFFVIHMIFEGYIISLGNSLALLFWMTLSVTLFRDSDPSGILEQPQCL